MFLTGQLPRRSALPVAGEHPYAAGRQRREVDQAGQRRARAHPEVAVSVEKPAFVTVVPERAAKLSAVPRSTGCCAADAVLASNADANAATQVIASSD